MKTRDVLAFIFFLLPFIILFLLISWIISIIGDWRPDINLLSILPFLIVASIILIIFLEIKIGKYIGCKLTKDSGLILGIILIILGFTIFIGIPIIIYSNKNKDEINVNLKVNENDDINVHNMNTYKKFFGKNYKDILFQNNLGEYIDLFNENKLTEIEIISELNDSDLEKIGIKIMGDRKKILKIFSMK